MSSLQIKVSGVIMFVPWCLAHEFLTLLIVIGDDLKVLIRYFYLLLRQMNCCRAPNRFRIKAIKRER